MRLRLSLWAVILRITLFRYRSAAKPHSSCSRHYVPTLYLLRLR